MGGLKLCCFFWLFRLVKDVGLSRTAISVAKIVSLVVRELGKSGVLLKQRKWVLSFLLFSCFYPMNYGLKVRVKGSMWGLVKITLWRFIECLNQLKFFMLMF